LNRRLNESQSQSGHFGDKENLFSLPGIEPLLGQPVA